MDQSRIDELHGEHWRKGWGSVSPLEVAFLQDQIAAARPRRFAEIGMASGLSGGFIAALMAENGGESFMTFDRDELFFGDRTKPNGYLIEAIYPGGPVAVDKRMKTTALDLAGSPLRFDMAFVDANHQHPWPLIDTLFLSPLLEGARVVIHHDLNLYRKQDRPIGIGPKYLWDQFPERLRERSARDDGNIFALKLDITDAELASLAHDAFQLPWSLAFALEDAQIDAVEALLKARFPAALPGFSKGLKRFNAAAPRHRVDAPTRAARVYEALVGR
ncbi:MAG: class I SAM-dependent methyltransferase [Pseudomonadota bacterium]